MANVNEDLGALFEAERQARARHRALLAQDHGALVEALRGATREALAIEDETEASVRLVRLAMLLGDLEGDAVVDLLVDILGSDLPEARVASGEALEALAYDRFKEVAMGIDRALGRLPSGSPALTELPFLLAEVAEPGCTKLLGKFLQHEDAEAVAAAIEALAELGDPSAVPMLAKLERDGRQVHIEDEDGEKGDRVSIADLATEARELLEEMAGDDGPRGAARPGGAARPDKKGPRG